MARLKVCPDCAESVQREAKVCRYCGYRFDLNPAPVRKAGGIRKGVILAIGLAVLALSHLGKSENASTSKRQAVNTDTGASASSSETAHERSKQEEAQAAQAAADKARQEAECRQDLQCWGDKKLISASVRCDDEIERLAKYEFEWTDGWLEPKFSRFGWNNKEQGIVAYWGDTIKFQNGFGAFQQHSYKCIYDTLKEKVVEVTAWPGRI